MPGAYLTDQQIRLYMKLRPQGVSQQCASAKAGFSERSGRRIDHQEHRHFNSPHPSRHWRTRTDPLETVWSNELVPLLEVNPELLPITLLDYLCQRYPDQFDRSISRTLQRRVKAWKLKYGPGKEVMFRQCKVPGQQGISDFTELKGVEITLQGKAFPHRFFHYRLAYSGWCYLKVICGGESYAALSAGLQDALWQCGGVPKEHRTDSLTAAWTTQSEKKQLTTRYADLCRHYGLTATHNTPGKAHENGAIESPHGHFKRRLQQALMLRGHHDFPSLADYQAFVDQIAHQMNQRHQSAFQEEQRHLQSLPKARTHDYGEHYVMISSSSTFRVKRVTYTVPSQYIGTRLLVRLHDERLELYHGMEHLLTLPRIYAPTKGYGHHVNYRHVIESLARKPQAFWQSQLKDHLLPSEDYRLIWQAVVEQMDRYQACHYMVHLLWLAARCDQESALGRFVLKQQHLRQKLPALTTCRERFLPADITVPAVNSQQHNVQDYDDLLPGYQSAKDNNTAQQTEVNHG